MANAPHSDGAPARKSFVPTTERSAPNPDAGILAAFAHWQALSAERKVLAETGNYAADDPLFTIEERALWGIIDAAATAVHDLPATTPAGVACKLWIVIPRSTDYPEAEAAAFNADLGWFEAQGNALDWSLRCIVSALVALKSMEG